MHYTSFKEQFHFISYIEASCLFGANPFREPVPTFCQLEYDEQTLKNVFENVWYMSSILFRYHCIKCI